MYSSEVIGQIPFGDADSPSSRRMSTLVLLIVTFLSFPIVTRAQSSFKGEVRVPQFSIRIKQPLTIKPTRKPVPAPQPPAKGPTKTYDDAAFVASFEATLANGNDALTAGDFDDALGYFEQAAALTTDDLRPLIGMGVALWNKKQFAEAYAKFFEAEKRFQAERPTNLSPGRIIEAEQIYSGLGFTALKLGNFDASLKAYLNVHDEAPANRVMVANNMGVALANVPYFHESESQFQYALSVDPKAQDVRLNLGMLYVMQRLREKAEAVRVELAQADPYRAGMLQREIEALR